MSLEMNSLLAVSGVGPSTVQALIDGGFSSLAQVKATPPEELTAVKGIDAARLQMNRQIDLDYPDRFVFVKS